MRPSRRWAALARPARGWVAAMRPARVRAGPVHLARAWWVRARRVPGPRARLGVLLTCPARAWGALVPLGRVRMRLRAWVRRVQLARGARGPVGSVRVREMLGGLRSGR